MRPTHTLVFLVLVACGDADDPTETTEPFPEPAGPTKSVSLGPSWSLPLDGPWAQPAGTAEVVWLVSVASTDDALALDAFDREGTPLARRATWSAPSGSVGRWDVAGRDDGTVALVATGDQDPHLVIGVPDEGWDEVPVEGQDLEVQATEDGWLVAAWNTPGFLGHFDARGVELASRTLDLRGSALGDLAWYGGLAVYTRTDQATRDRSLVLDDLAGSTHTIAVPEGPDNAEIRLGPAGPGLLAATTSPSAITVRSVDLDSLSLGGPVRITSTPRSMLGWSGLTALSQGSLLTWADRGPWTDGVGEKPSEIRAMWFDDDGGAGPVEILVSDAACDLWYPDVLAGDMLTWIRYCPDAEPQETLHLAPITFVGAR